MADHDHILLNTLHFGPTRVMLDELADISWPPPERIYMDGETFLLREAVDGDEPEFIFKRISMSQLTDEEIAKCPNVARGAEYAYELAIN